MFVKGANMRADLECRYLCTSGSGAYSSSSCKWWALSDTRRAQTDLIMQDNRRCSACCKHTRMVLSSAATNKHKHLQTDNSSAAPAAARIRLAPQICSNPCKHGRHALPSTADDVSRGVQLGQAQTLLVSPGEARVRQHMHLTSTTALTSGAAEACKDRQPRRALTRVCAWARQAHSSVTHFHCSRGIQGDPPQPSTDSAHIGVHWELRHSQAEQHDAGHAFAPQACSRPAQGLA